MAPARSVFANAMRPCGCVAQHIPRRRLAAHAEEEARLRIHVRVTPAIQDDPRDVATRIEAAGREHVGELLAERALVLRERCPQELRAPLRTLLGDRQPGLREQHLDRQHRRRIRTDRRALAAHRGHPSHREVVAESLEPAAPRHSHLVQEAPVAHRDVRHEARRSIELRVRFAMARGEVAHDVLARPASTGHHHRACLDAEEPFALRVRDHDVRRAGRTARMLDAHDGRVEANARILPRPIERGKVHSTLPHRVYRVGSGERVGDECLHHEPRESGVPVGEHLVA